MHVKIVLICEDPKKNSRKVWAAEFVDSEARVHVKWGRIPRGTSFQASDFERFAGQHQVLSVEDAEAAENFINRKVREKVKKGYQSIVHTVDGVDFAMFSNRQPDNNERIRMKTFNGRG